MFGITDRRHFLTHVAGAAAVATPGAHFLTGLRAQAAELKKANKSLVVLWMGGGPATIDLWDMKPDSSNGGLHKPKPTAASGISISEHLPKVGAQFKHLSVVRSLTTSEGDHNRGTTLMSTGRSPNALTEFPHLGSVLSYQYAQDLEAMKGMDLPSFISVGGNRVGPGFLGMKYAAFSVQNAGNAPENVLPPDQVRDRMQRRKILFDALEGGFETNVAGDSAQAHRDVYSKALQLVTSSRKEVFEFKSAEDQKDLLRYAPDNNGFGRGCLLAKKLLSQGVSCVEVSLGGWDMHNGIFASLERTLPQLDAGMAALTDDLAKTGKLKDTVIVWMGEFGRTPKINQNGGRDHWPRCWSVVVGGGNLKGGVAVGSTSADGTEVKDSPAKISDLYTTLYKGLGLDPATQIRDNLGRPTAIGGEGTAIKELVG